MTHVVAVTYGKRVHVRPAGVDGSQAMSEGPRLVCGGSLPDPDDPANPEIRGRFVVGDFLAGNFDGSADWTRFCGYMAAPAQNIPIISRWPTYLNAGYLRRLLPGDFSRVSFSSTSSSLYAIKKSC